MLIMRDDQGPTEILRGLRDKLAGMMLQDNTGDPHDEGYMAAWHEVSAWLDERESPTMSGDHDYQMVPDVGRSNRYCAERDRYRTALDAICLHHAMPAGESWEDAYNEVCSIAIGACDDDA